MLYEILRDTPAFQEIAKQGWKEGLKEGREEGLKEGLNALQAALQTLIEMRFPDPELIHLLKEKVDAIEDPHILQRLIVQVGTAQIAEEVRNYLLNESLTEG